MRLKFIACKYTVFIPFRILARNIFSFLSTKTNRLPSQNKLNANQPYLFFREIIITQSHQCIVYFAVVDSLIIDIQHVVFIIISSK